MRNAALVALLPLAGCHAMFGLDEVGEYVPAADDAAVDDGGVDGKDGCGPRSAMAMSKLIGPRTNGLSPGLFADTFISSDTAHINSNFGAVDKLYACNQCACALDCDGVAGGDDDVVTLIRVDLSVDVPACSQVMYATLMLDTTTDVLSAGSDVAVYPLLQDWEEGTGALPDGMLGAANWQANTGSTMWLSAGAGIGGAGDSRSSVMMGTFRPTTTGTFSVALDPAVVQGWLDNPATNHGMVILVYNNPSDVHFYSGEVADSAKAPALQVTYYPPL